MFEFIFLVALLLGWMGTVATTGFPARPKPLAPPEPTPEPSPNNDNEVVARMFIWQRDIVGQEQFLSVEVQVRIDAYKAACLNLLHGDPNKTLMHSNEECASIARQQILDENFGMWSAEVGNVAAYLSLTADENLLSEYEKADLVLSFAQEQCIRYMLDKESTPMKFQNGQSFREYFRYPIETICDQVGDCDCKAILASALFAAMGYEVAFALMPGHAALAVSLPEDMPFYNYEFMGRGWLYCEATGDSWKPGQLPRMSELRAIELFPLHD